MVRWPRFGKQETIVPKSTLKVDTVIAEQEDGNMAADVHIEGNEELLKRLKVPTE